MLVTTKQKMKACYSIVICLVLIGTIMYLGFKRRFIATAQCNHHIDTKQTIRLFSGCDNYRLRTDRALVRHERGARVERPEAIEAGGGARARDGGVGAVRFGCRGSSKIGAKKREHKCVLQ